MFASLRKLILGLGSVLAVGLCLAMASPVTALTCIPRHLGDHLEAHFDADKVPTVIFGYFRELKDQNKDLPSILNLPLRSEPSSPAIAKVKISGPVIEAGQEIRFGRHVAQWISICALQGMCGDLPRNPGMALFVLLNLDGTLMGGVGPCGGSIYPMATPAQIDAIQSCITNRHCGANTTVLEGLVARPFSR
ncbi:MAG: hypothetical protein AAFQ05_05315 [Pseudomonadota bacterium]